MTPDQLAQAVCSHADPSMFFPDTTTLVGIKGEAYTRAWRDLAAPALELCAVCPVREACLAAALDDRDLDGIRGGKTPPELRELARQLPRRRGYPGHRTHGTDGGYTDHIRRRETPCVPCREAHAAYKREWKARRRAS